MLPTTHNTFTQLIGKTPLVDLSAMIESSAKLYAKCEFMNPGMSMKDRVIQHILDKAEQTGQLKSGDTIICASSGNTGCSTALLGGIRGYHVIIVTAHKCSQEKQNHIRAFNAELLVVDEHDYMNHAGQLAQQHGYFDINQYDNLENPQAYYLHFAPELWQQSQQQLTHFVMTASTFGCISGTARYLKQQNPNIKIILADPAASNMSHYFRSYQKNQCTLELNLPKQDYLIEGAGKTRPTRCTDFSLIDQVIDISDQEAINCCHRLAQQEGIFVGGSSGLNIAACQKLAQEIDEGMITSVLCDHGIKYLSKIYNPNFLQQHNIELSPDVPNHTHCC